MKLLVAFMLFTSFCFGQKVDISIKLVDLIIHNAKIISGPYTPEYSAMVVNNGTILALYKNNNWKNQNQFNNGKYGTNRNFY